MPEENRVFDVSKPGHHHPSPTSKPVIVGHQPTISDPMVKDDDAPAKFAEPEPTKINVSDHSEPADDQPGPPAVFDTGNEDWRPPFDEQPAEELPVHEVKPAPPEPDDSPFRHSPEPAPPAEPSWPEAPASDDIAEPARPEQPIEPPAHVEALHMPQPKRRSPLLPILLALLALVIAAYLAIDSGLINTNINLPVHVFKQKSDTTAASNPPSPPVNTTPAIPAGFTDYKLTGTDLSFAAPASWGHPNSSTDQGYTARGGGNKTNGNYAYLVTFDKNSDIQMAVTSSQYLPPARAALYYDYLGWCVGTNDGKYYLGVLRYSTDSSKIDRPSTITCDQGPLIGVTKIDSSTIVQLNAKTADGKPAGDLYTKNLQDKDLPVFRVKDSAMTSADNIKKLLNTIQFSSGS